MASRPCHDRLSPAYLTSRGARPQRQPRARPIAAAIVGLAAAIVIAAGALTPAGGAAEPAAGPAADRDGRAGARRPACWCCRRTPSCCRASTPRPAIARARRSGSFAIPHEIAATADGGLLFITNYGVKSFRDTAPGTNMVTIVDAHHVAHVGTVDLGENHRPHGIARGRSGRFYVTTDLPPALVVIDPVKRAVVARYPLDQKLPHMVVVTADERRALVANAGSGTVSVVPIDKPPAPPQKAPPRAIAIGGTPMGLALSDDGRWLYASNRDGNQIVRIDLARSTVASRIVDSRRALAPGAGEGRAPAGGQPDRGQRRRRRRHRERARDRPPAGRAPARGGAAGQRAPARLRLGAGRRQGGRVLDRRLEDHSRDQHRRSPRRALARSRAGAARAAIRSPRSTATPRRSSAPTGWRACRRPSARPGRATWPPPPRSARPISS